jgi:hypothetical protein
MESNQFIQQGKQRSAIRVSGKLFNEDDGLICPPKKFGKGRIFAPAGLRYVPLVVGPAGNMPRQQTRKIGQMTPYCLNRL